MSNVPRTIPQLSTQATGRFWSKVERRGACDCWPWKGARHPAGYGVITFEHKTWTASRVAWQLVHGPIPEGLCVCHTCDNPACCNPCHLWVGTHSDNMRDSVIKGRGRGQTGAGAKLTETQVRQIRALCKRPDWASGAYARPSQKSLAKRFGVCEATISGIVRGNKWKHCL